MKPNEIEVGTTQNGEKSIMRTAPHPQNQGLNV
jgi:hypothetical protein